MPINDLPQQLVQNSGYRRCNEWHWRAVALLFITLALLPQLCRAAVMPFANVKQLMDEGNYGAAMQELTKIQHLSPDSAVARQYDFFDVAMLAADCQLHAGTKTRALQAADTAITLADAAEDQDRLGRATALYVMIDKARNNTYIPRTGDSRTPIDIMDPKSRESAYPFILADEVDAFKQAKWKSRASVSLAPVMDAARHFAGVRALEHLVTGNTDQSEKLGIAASKDVNGLITNWLKDRNHDLDRLTRNAQQQVQVTQITTHGLRTVSLPAGLGTDRQTVLNYVSDCNQLPDAIQAINKGFGGSLELDGIYRSADDLKQRAQNLLDKYPGN